ncbi:flagellar hook-basal body complex protein [Zooshikella harenae]|uniref:Flagellar hook basal-body protein n=1 Tax=Zooshikella harenae TaxID=2827238 RepID=A0ABS5ZC66_9GAMM|nr:flagellar hook-basal body complex protein [Zooshikella harenae]MBU2711651.1 flagellar hook basal-body protein [Zooshikella harenae]
MSDLMSVLNISASQDLQSLNNITHNLANTNTNAYKRWVDVNKGLTSTNSSSMDLSTGSLHRTNRYKDIALKGSGFFVVKQQGQTYLTRRGELEINKEGYLTLASGERLQGQSGDIILEPKSFSVDQHGNIIQDNVVKDSIQVVNANLTGDHYLGNGLFRHENTTPVQQQNKDIIQQHLESSNAVAMDEMVNLINLNRHYESIFQVANGYNSLLEKTISDLGDF